MLKRKAVKAIYRNARVDRNESPQIGDKFTGSNFLESRPGRVMVTQPVLP